MSIFRLRRNALVAIVLLSCGALHTHAEEPRLLEPSKVEEEGRYTFRWFTARPGDVVASTDGGNLEVIEIRQREVVMKRAFRGSWIVGDYNFGNHEYLSITSIDAPKQTVTLRFRTKNKLYLWEAFSF